MMMIYIDDNAELDGWHMHSIDHHYRIMKEEQEQEV